MARPKKITREEATKSYRRDEYGLLENAEYLFQKDGSVDWRSMIDEEHLYPNRSRFPDGVPEQSIDKFKDHELIIKLSGIKELARLRGIKDVHYDMSGSATRAIAKCTITFLPNYETEMKEVSFQEVASAHKGNTDSFGQNFLESIAANRAFVRCVRNFLNIHIVGDAEIPKDDAPQSKPESSATGMTPQDVLKRTLEDKLGVVDFDGAKTELRKLWEEDVYRNDDAAEWMDFEDIPAKEARTLIGIFKKR